MNEPIIRVLHITEMLSAAGIESFIMNMYRNIDRDKVQFDFLVLRNEKEFYDEEIKSLGGKKYFVHSNIKNTWLRILDEAHQIEEFLKIHPYEIVHIHYTTPLRAPYLLAAKKAGVATRIYHAHSAAVSGKSKLKLLFYEYYRKKIVKWGTTWFACSKAAAEWIFPEQLLQAGNVEIVHNGIDTERFKYNASKRNMIRKQLGLNKLNESGADIVFCKLNEFKEDGKKVLLPMTINEGMLNPVVTVMGIGTQTLVAHSYVFKNLRFDPEFPRFQELELLYRASKSFSIYCIGEGLVDYYIGKDSISSNPEKLYNACLLMKTKHPELEKYMPQLEKDLGSCLKTAGVNAYRVGNENYKKYIYEAGKFNRTLKMKIIVMLARMNMLKVFYK